MGSLSDSPRFPKRPEDALEGGSEPAEKRNKA